MSATTIRRPAAGQVRVEANAFGSMIAATVMDVGYSGDGFVRGDRVVFPLALGEHPVVDVGTLIGVPKNVSDRQAADLLAPGLLARAMIAQVRPLARGDRAAVMLGNSTLRQVVSAWVESLGGVLVEDLDTADVIYNERARRLAAVEASHRRGKLQESATEVFQVIRAGVFDGVHVEHNAADRVAA